MRGGAGVKPTREFQGGSAGAVFGPSPTTDRTSLWGCSKLKAQA